MYSCFPVSSSFQYYEMSYGLNIEMHKQVCSHIRDGLCKDKTMLVFRPENADRLNNTKGTLPDGDGLIRLK